MAQNKDNQKIGLDLFADEKEQIVSSPKSTIGLDLFPVEKKSPEGTIETPFGSYRDMFDPSVSYAESIPSEKPKKTKTKVEGPGDIVLSTDVSPEEITLGQDLGRALNSSSQKVGASLLGLPSFIHETTFAVRTPFLRAFGYSDKEIEQLKMSEKAAPTTIPGMPNLMIGEMQAQAINKSADNVAKTMRQYDKGIYESLKAGEFSDAGAQIARGATQSLPYLALTAATAGGGAVPTLVAVGSVSASGRYTELNDSKLTQNERLGNAWLYGAAEGGGAVISAGIMKGIPWAKLAPPQAKKIADGFAFQFLANMGLEGVEEMTTELAQQTIDMGYGMRETIDMSQVYDAGIIGSATGGGMGLPSQVKNLVGRRLATDQQTGEVAENNIKINDLKADISQTDNVSLKETLAKQINDYDAKNQKIYDEVNELVDKMKPEEIKKANDIYNAIKEYNTRIENKDSDTSLEETIRDQLINDMEVLKKELTEPSYTIGEEKYTKAEFLKELETKKDQDIDFEVRNDEKALEEAKKIFAEPLQQTKEEAPVKKAEDGIRKNDKGEEIGDNDKGEKPQISDSGKTEKEKNLREEKVAPQSETEAKPSEMVVQPPIEETAEFVEEFRSKLPEEDTKRLEEVEDNIFQLEDKVQTESDQAKLQELESKLQTEKEIYRDLSVELKQKLDPVTKDQKPEDQKPEDLKTEDIEDQTINQEAENKVESPDVKPTETVVEPSEDIPTGIKKEEVETPPQDREPETTPNLEKDIEINKIQPDDTKFNPIIKSGASFFNVDTSPDKVNKVVSREFKSEGLMPKEVFERQVQEKANVNARVADVEFTRKEFERKAKEVFGRRYKIGKKEFGRSKIPMQDLTKMNTALKNMGTTQKSQEAALKGVPESMHEVLVDMRNQIDAMSRELMRSGMLQGDLEGTIQDNLGLYMTRSYKVFEDKKWSYENIEKGIKKGKLAEKSKLKGTRNKKIIETGQVYEKIMNKAVAEIRQTYPELNDLQVEGKIRELMDRDNSQFKLISEGQLTASDLGILKKRKDIPEAILDLLGEYQDPLYNYSVSVSKMANLLEKHKFTKDIIKMGKDKFLFTEPTGEYSRKIETTVPTSRVGIDKKHFKEVANLGEYYTKPEIAEALSGINDIEGMANWLKAYMKVNSLVKLGKTVGNPGTHAVNYLSNYSFQVFNGRFPFTKKAFQAHQTVIKGLQKKNDPEFQAYYKELVERGVLGEGARTKDVTDRVREGFENWEKFSKQQDNLLTNLGKGAWEKTKKLYEAEDEVHRVIAYEIEKTRYEKVYQKQGLENYQEKAKETAARIMNQTMPTWSRIPKAVKQLRRFPLVGSFVSFSSELMRTSIGTAKLIKEEMKDPATKNIAKTRMAGMASVLGTVGGLPTMMALMGGTSTEDQNDLKNFVAPWNKNSPLLVFGGEKGLYKYIDIGRVSAFGYYNKMFEAFTRGLDIEQAALEATKEAFEPFVGEEILAGFIDDIKDNQQIDGRPIYNPEDTGRNQFEQIAEYAVRKLSPGIISSSNRIYKASKGEMQGATQLSLQNELLSLFGLRTSTVDVGKSFGYQLDDYADKIQNAQNIYNAVRKDQKASQKEVDDAYDDANKALQRNFTELNKLYKSALNLGAPRDGLIKDIVKMRKGDYNASMRIKGYVLMGNFKRLNRETGKIL